MKRTWIGVAFLAMFIGLPESAAALPCPSPTVEGNVYFLSGTGTTTVTQCVYESGSGNLNGSNNDDFLDGPNDDRTAPYFGGGWTSFCSTDSDNLDDPDNTCTPAYDFTWDDTTWSFDGVLGTEYALGIKAGGDPMWSVFLLANTDLTNPVAYSGTWSILKDGQLDPDALSHWAIYDRLTGGGGGGSGQSPVPEPASLILLGSGLVVAARQIRRRSAKQ